MKFLFIDKLIFASGVAALSLPAVSQPRSEPIQVITPAVIENHAKIDLGKQLFFDPRLSKSGVLSCNSCHNLATGGADNTPSSIGHGWQLGPINSPTVLNATFNLAQFWDGRAKDLREQAAGPIENPKEMASNHGLVIEVLESIPSYKRQFQSVYDQKAINIDQITDAIASFEETLVTPNSRFDQWLSGSDSALTDLENKGYQLFKSKGCIACHNGVAVGGSSFQKMGVVKAYPDTENLGRYNVTGLERDKYVFKVPTLRNIELTAPYFHDASTWELSEAVDMMAEYQLGLSLTREENTQIVAFLKTLTGDQPSVLLPVLPPSTALTPKPILQ